MPPPTRFIYNTLNDPNLVLRIREVLCAQEREEIHLFQHQLIEKNNALGGTSGAFLYAGEFISFHSRSVYKKWSILPLHASLESEGAIFWRMLKAFQQAWKDIHQLLSIVLPQVRTIEQLRDMFPEILASQIWPSLGRQTPEDQALALYPHLKKPMEKLVEIGLLSQAKRLLD